MRSTRTFDMTALQSSLRSGTTAFVVRARYEWYTSRLALYYAAGRETIKNIKIGCAGCAERRRKDKEAEGQRTRELCTVQSGRVGHSDLDTVDGGKEEFEPFGAFVGFKPVFRGMPAVISFRTEQTSWCAWLRLTACSSGSGRGAVRTVADRAPSQGRGCTRPIPCRGK